MEINGASNISSFMFKLNCIQLRNGLAELKKMKLDFDVEMRKVDGLKNVTEANALRAVVNDKIVALQQGLRVIRRDDKCRLVQENRATINPEEVISRKEVERKILTLARERGCNIDNAQVIYERIDRVGNLITNHVNFGSPFPLAEYYSTVENNGSPAQIVLIFSAESRHDRETYSFIDGEWVKLKLDL
jgi:hypothetical protein